MVTQYLSVCLSESVYDGKRLRQLSMCGWACRCWATPTPVWLCAGKGGVTCMELPSLVTRVILDFAGCLAAQVQVALGWPSSGHAGAWQHSRNGYRCGASQHPVGPSYSHGELSCSIARERKSPQVGQQHWLVDASFWPCTGMPPLIWACAACMLGVQPHLVVCGVRWSTI